MEYFKESSIKWREANKMSARLLGPGGRDWVEARGVWSSLGDSAKEEGRGLDKTETRPPQQSKEEAGSWGGGGRELDVTH